MKAAILEGPGRIVYQEVETPRPGPGEVLVRVKAVSICGSDLLRVFNGAAKTYPLILGHECAGIVVEAGEGVAKEHVGRRVAVAPLLPCMQCPACQRGIYSSCEQYSFIGSRQAGGFAEYVVAPLRNLIDLPEKLDFEVGAILEPSTVALHALERGEIAEGLRVAILGAGSIGLCAVQWARIKKAGLIISTDVVDENLAASKMLGAHLTLNARQEDVVASAMAETGDGVDLALEVSGSPEGLMQAVMMLRPRGIVVCVGNQPPEAMLPASIIEHITRRENELRGTWMSYSAPFPGHEWSDSVAAILRGDLHVQTMISHRFPLSAIEDVFQQIHSHALIHRKIILIP